MGKLAHPNIVRALDAGEADGRHYLVMEYIDGIDLSRLSRRCGPLPVPEACELLQQAALALQHAHEHNLVHRDIKPSNVMLTRDGHVKLLDLGIALLQPEEPLTSDLTGTGQVMGTLDYMAPEQLDNTHTVDIRADVYGLGATLYKLLCGSAPATDSGSRFRLPGEKIPPVPDIRTIRPDIPQPVAAVLEKMLAPNPDGRYATPAEVAEALKPFTAKSNLKQLALAASSDAPPRVIPPKKRFSGRLRRWVIGLSLLLGILLAGYAVTVQTDKGKIVINSSVDDIQVLVKRTGKVFDSLDTLEVDKGDNHWAFRSGSYEVQLVGETDGLRVKDGTFELTRDGEVVVTIERDVLEKKTAVSVGPVYQGKTLDEWIALLTNEKSTSLRSDAILPIKTLGTEAPEQAIAALFKVGSEYDFASSSGTLEQEVRTEAIESIRELSEGRPPQVLIASLNDSDVKRRRLAAYLLAGEWKPPLPISVARKAANDSDSYVRTQSAQWLRHYGRESIPDLLSAFEDEDDNVRQSAVTSISFLARDGKITPEDSQVVLPKLYQIWQDKNSAVKRAVLYAALAGNETDLNKLSPILVKTLKNPEEENQRLAIQLFGRLDF